MNDGRSKYDRKKSGLLLLGIKTTQKHRPPSVLFGPTEDHSGGGRRRRITAEVAESHRRRIGCVPRSSGVSRCRRPARMAGHVTLLKWYPGEHPMNNWWTPGEIDKPVEWPGNHPKKVLDRILTCFDPDAVLFGVSKAMKVLLLASGKKIFFFQIGVKALVELIQWIWSRFLEH